VKQGFAREDLFVCVHEQFMTETAKYADVLLPATMFLEHDDIYQGGGHSHILFGRKLVNEPGECKTNHEVISEIAKRVGADHRGFAMTPREIIDETLVKSNRPNLEVLDAENWVDVQSDFDTTHYIKGFGHSDGKYHFKPDWKRAAWLSPTGQLGPYENLPEFPDYYTAIELANDEYPFRLATSPARTFLNSTFNETPSSLKREGRPTVFVHPQDLSAYGLSDGDKVKLGSARGQVTLHAKAHDGQRRGVLISESLWPNDAFEDGCGINTLTGSDQPAPAGGGSYHDNRVWMRKA
jgi:anaerobic selenocysteine-containing dehydrogenase